MDKVGVRGVVEVKKENGECENGPERQAQC
jgi:hypothetical protein